MQINVIFGLYAVHLEGNIIFCSELKKLIIFLSPAAISF